MFVALTAARLGPNPGGSTMVRRKSRAFPPKLADTDGQIQQLWDNDVSKQCVSIPSIDTTPTGTIPQQVRERWLRELRRTVVALSLLVDRLVAGAPEQ
jgi:hypothetical protein